MITWDGPAYVARTARIHDSVRLGEGCVIGDHAIIGPGVVVGDRATVGPYARVWVRATIGPEAKVGRWAVVGPYAKVGAGVSICDGERVPVAWVEEKPKGFGLASPDVR